MMRSRVLTPLLAALAVVALLAGIWWATTASNSPAEAQPGSGPGVGVAPTGDEPAGDGEPGNPGTAKPDPVPVEPEPDHGTPAPGSVPVASYYLESPRVLKLNYAIGIPECYGTVGEAKVEETDGSVRVLLVHTPAKAASDVACIDIALMESISVTLDSPLGDRVVKDAAFADKTVDRGDAAYDAQP